MRDETGCAGIMIARGTHGGPWIFRAARAALDGVPVPPDPDVAERFQICLEHARNAIAFERDGKKAVLEFRKHLGWYTKGLPGGRDLRQELFKVTTMEEMTEALQGYLDEPSVASRRAPGVATFPPRACRLDCTSQTQGASRLRRVW
jgi:tRNA-dihydrouridine synthase B